MIERIQELVKLLNLYTKDYDLGQPKISDKEWDLWLLNRDQWKKELHIFASRSAKIGKGINKNMKKK
jgi:NAD-dependent DNA ligase